MSLTTASRSNAIEAIQAALEEQPDGVLDDIARRHGISLRLVLDRAPFFKWD